MADENIYLNDVSTGLNAATEQKVGNENLAELDYKDIIGKELTEGQKEQWLSKISQRIIKTIYTDASYNVKDNDIFYEDEDSFGGIVQVINMEMPDAIANRSWIQVTSGETQIGVNTVYLPVVEENLYGGISAWEIPVTVSGWQMRSAFRDASGMARFESMVKTVAQNAIAYRQEIMNGINRNNYIANKIHVATTQTTKKAHVVNLVKEYLDYFGGTAMTVQEFLKNPDCLRFAVKTFKKYKALLMRMTTLFTSKTGSKGKFIPPDRFVFQVLSDFAGMVESQLYSDTYHNEFVTLPLYREVASWQALDDATSTADFKTLSSINVKTGEAEQQTVSKSGIVGVMLDKWAVMRTTVQRRVGVQHDDIKDITLYAHQFTDRYVNNLTLNGVVFTVEDVSAD